MNPRILLDEDINPAAAPLLSAAGIDTVSIRDAGRLGLRDEEQFAYARAEGRVFVTYNYHDFERIAEREAGASRTHPGIIVSYHQYSSEETGVLVRMLTDLLRDRTTEDLVNAYLILPRIRQS